MDKSARKGPARLDLDAALTTRLANALLFPLQGAALAAVVGLALSLIVTGLVPVLGWLLQLVVWAAAFKYALDVLEAASHGHAEAPEIALTDNGVGGSLLLLAQLLAILCIIVAAVWHVPALWWPPFVLALALPAATMSLALGDGQFAAFNPARVARAMAAFGAIYLLPVALGVIQYLAIIQAFRASGMITELFWYAVAMYVILLHFRLLGAMMYRHHEKIGHVPRPPHPLTTASDKDQDLQQEITSLADAGNLDAACAAMQERLNERGAGPDLHLAYRRLLQRKGDQAELRANAPACIASLLAVDETRRALVVVQETLELAPDFLPDDPAVVAELADAAERFGMNRLAIHLARAYPNAWPRDPEAPHYGLLAARLIARDPTAQEQAAVLARRLLQAYPDCGGHDELELIASKAG